MIEQLATSDSVELGGAGEALPQHDDLAGPLQPIRWYDQLLKIAILVMAVLYLLTFLYIAVKRLQYPYELQWIEGGVLQHIIRLRAGLQIYVKPTPEFVPFIYTPFYYVVSALATKIFGIGFFAPRLVSVLATNYCLALIFILVRRETRSWFAAAFAAGLFISSYRVAGTLFDCVQCDALFLALFLSAVFVVRVNQSWSAIILVAILLYLATMTKQVALGMSIPVLIYLTGRNWRKGLFTALLLFGGFAMTVVIADRITHGWFSFYTLRLPSHHKLAPSMFVRFPFVDIGQHAGIAALLGIFAILNLRALRRRDSFWFWILIEISLLGGAFSMRVHSGGYDNVILAAYVGISLLGGVGVAAAERRLRAMSDAPGGGPSTWPYVTTFFYAALMFQLCAMIYFPVNQIPSIRDRAAGDALIARLREVKGDVLISFHPYYGIMAGHRSCFHDMAVQDIVRADRTVGDPLVKEIDAAIRDKRYSMIVREQGREEYKPLDPPAGYRASGFTFDDSSVFWQVTGGAIRPGELYVPE